MIDYTAMLTELRGKRDAIDQIIDGFQRLLGEAQSPVVPVEVPAVVKKVAPKPKAPVLRAIPASVPKKKDPPHRKGAGKTANRRLTAQEMALFVEGYTLGGKTVPEMAKVLHCAEQVLYYHVRVKGLKRALMPGERLCPGCQTRTRFDPCHVCQKPARKSA